MPTAQSAFVRHRNTFRCVKLPTNENSRSDPSSNVQIQNLIHPAPNAQITPATLQNLERGFHIQAGACCPGHDEIKICSLLEENGFLKQLLRRDCEAERAEFSTKDSATAERCYPGNALCCGGERERCKVGYTVLYTMLIGDVRQAAKDHSSLDWSFFGSFATHSVSMHT